MEATERMKKVKAARERGERRAHEGSGLRRYAKDIKSAASTESHTVAEISERMHAAEMCRAARAARAARTVRKRKASGVRKTAPKKPVKHYMTI